MKERAKRAGAWRKDEESERKHLQVFALQNVPCITIKLLFSLSPAPPPVSPAVSLSLASQTKLEQTEGELRSLSKEFQSLRNSLAQRDTSVLQLQSTITTLTQKLTTAHRKEVRLRLSYMHIQAITES